MNGFRSMLKGLGFGAVSTRSQRCLDDGKVLIVRVDDAAPLRDPAVVEQVRAAAKRSDCNAVVIRSPGFMRAAVFAGKRGFAPSSDLREEVLGDAV